MIPNGEYFVNVKAGVLINQNDGCDYGPKFNFNLLRDLFIDQDGDLIRICNGYIFRYPYNRWGIGNVVRRYEKV